MQDNSSIGFIGLGSMGMPMAENLLADGHALHVYNRSVARTDQLVARGATRAATPAALAESCRVVFTLVSDDHALEEIVLGDNGLLGKLGHGGIHVSVSTIAPATARRLAALHAAHGEIYVSAPVFGRSDVVADKKIRFCVSGDAAARAQVRPLLETLGMGVYDFGDDSGAANAVKLAGNFMIAAAIETMAEAYTLLEKNGVAREQAHDLFSQTFFACPVYQNYGRLVAEQRYEPAFFKLPLGRKDLWLLLQTAHESQTALPFASVLHERMTATMARGGEYLDWTGLAQNVSEQAGLTVRANSQ